MIPKLVHFIFGLDKDFGKRPFSYTHYLAIISAKKCLLPENIFFHCEFEPNGYWWNKAKKLVTINRVKSPSFIFGNQINAFQHKADVLRLEILKEYGGIYLDIDIISLNSFDNLLIHNNVMGIEPSVGLCNAVILAEKNSKFINTWYETYNSFNNKNWNYHSIVIPLKIASSMKDEIKVESYYSFFYPFYKDNAQFYLWGVKPEYKMVLFEFIKNILIKTYSFYPYFDCKYFPILHQYKSLSWHLHKMNQSYCIHLWESLWWERYLKHLSPDFILSNTNSLFCKLILSRLTEYEIDGQI